MRGAGVEIEVLIEYMSLFEKGKSTVKARKKLLEEQREKLLEKQKNINETVDRLNYKISLYEESSLSREKEIYNIKKFYLNELKKIEFEQKEKLISDLENKDDFFSVQLIRLLKEIINLEDKVIRVRRKKEIKNQLSLF